MSRIGRALVSWDVLSAELRRLPSLVDAEAKLIESAKLFLVIGHYTISETPSRP